MLVAALVIAGVVTPTAGAAEAGSVAGSFRRTTGASVAQARVDLTDQHGNSGTRW
ncbi:hypothetical protein [Saccharothrix stipae]